MVRLDLPQTIFAISKTTVLLMDKVQMPFVFVLFWFFLLFRFGAKIRCYHLNGSPENQATKDQRSPLVTGITL